MGRARTERDTEAKTAVGTEARILTGTERDAEAKTVVGTEAEIIVGTGRAIEAKTVVGTEAKITAGTAKATASPYLGTVIGGDGTARRDADGEAVVQAVREARVLFEMQVSTYEL